MWLAATVPSAVSANPRSPAFLASQSPHQSSTGREMVSREKHSTLNQKCTAIPCHPGSTDADHGMAVTISLRRHTESQRTGLCPTHAHVVHPDPPELPHGMGDNTPLSGLACANPSAPAWPSPRWRQHAALLVLALVLSTALVAAMGRAGATQMRFRRSVGHQTAPGAQWPGDRVSIRDPVPRPDRGQRPQPRFGPQGAAAVRPATQATVDGLGTAWVDAVLPHAPMAACGALALVSVACFLVGLPRLSTRAAAARSSPGPIHPARRSVPAMARYLLGVRGPSGHGSRSTAAHVGGDWGAAARGRVAVVTGCTDGIGLETARCLAAHGATVVMACRDGDKMRRAAAGIRRGVPGAAVHELRCDLACLRSVRDFVRAFRGLGLPCHLLINNAGVMTQDRGTTADGFETQFGVNHLGHFALTNLMAPYLCAGAPARVVNVASSAHSRAWVPEGIRLQDLAAAELYDPWGSYGQSKLANVLHAEQLNREFGRRRVDVRAFSVHPGVIGTALWRHLWRPAAAALRLSLRVLGKSVPQGAATTVYCALAPELRPGYYSDCNEGQLCHPSFGTDPGLAQRLWEVSEAMTETSLELDGECSDVV